MASVTAHLITADEFEQMEFERPAELVRGELVAQSMPTFQHGTVCAQVAIALGVWA